MIWKYSLSLELVYSAFGKGFAKLVENWNWRHDWLEVAFFLVFLWLFAEVLTMIRNGFSIYNVPLNRTEFGHMLTVYEEVFCMVADASSRLLAEKCIKMIPKVKLPLVRSGFVSPTLHRLLFSFDEYGHHKQWTCVVLARVVGIVVPKHGLALGKVPAEVSVARFSLVANPVSSCLLFSTLGRVFPALPKHKIVVNTKTIKYLWQRLYWCEPLLKLLLRLPWWSEHTIDLISRSEIVKPPCLQHFFFFQLFSRRELGLIALVIHILIKGRSYFIISL